MAKLRDLEISDRQREDSVAILVGPNGSGKSTFLRALAESYRHENVIAVSNTPHDRFARMRGIRRISAGRPDHTPPNIVKRAVARSLDADDSSFHQISAIMDYCGYAPRFGFRIEKAKHFGSSFDDLQWKLDSTRSGATVEDVAWDGEPDYVEQLHRALAFLSRHDPREFVWIDATRSAFEFSLAREFVAVLRCEAILRRLKVIGLLEVMLQREDPRHTVIEMRLASSGQLALISSLLFLITEAGRGAIILVDEPENSLHPSWQREYVDKLMAAMAYRNATLIVATHAPLVVTGALSDAPNKVSVFRVRDGRPARLEIDASAAPNSIEEILWEAFGVVTPANHFVSEEIVRAISRFEKDETGKEEVLQLIGALEERSFDDQQHRFFEAVRKLVDKVERAKAGIDDGDDGFA
ncbi:AAA family ATPase [Neotabrizicola shimadae]|uniref:AAA family ATPase n=1 Tax=Neotabrizicola shimadae TaxID=2807096 RepID=A0A8G0ZZ45_9RHOB|nr:ATP-binding protein [Neotabrizicola shimadae]QYZ72275.1 AAA family ATPase [Neotabrizicola shimadae]